MVILVTKLGGTEEEVERVASVQVIDEEFLQETGHLINDLGGEYTRVTPKSAIAKALAYSIERWERLSLYTKDGKLNIDNNPVENSIRPVALGYAA